MGFCAVSSIRKFSSQPEGSIQIHHDQDRSRWVTSCYVGGEVKLYDSMYQKGKGISLEKQLIAVYGETAARLPKGGGVLGIATGGNK